MTFPTWSSHPFICGTLTYGLHFQQFQQVTHNTGRKTPNSPSLILPEEGL